MMSKFNCLSIITRYRLRNRDSFIPSHLILDSEYYGMEVGLNLTSNFEIIQVCSYLNAVNVSNSISLRKQALYDLILMLS